MSFSLITHSTEPRERVHGLDISDMAFIKKHRVETVSFFPGDIPTDVRDYLTKIGYVAIEVKKFENRGTLWGFHKR